MTDRPEVIERAGVGQIPASERHGSPGRVFTLWFAANLTIADYVIGVLTTAYFRIGIGQAIPILVVGNVLGGVLLGLAAAMGPSLGFPQMFSSRASFGRRGNYIPGALNWVSTVGWFAVNTILSVEAIQVLAPWANFVLVAMTVVAVQVVIAVYGHDFIHLFEKVMSVVLGLLFLYVFYISLSAQGSVGLGGQLPATALGVMAVLFVICFSYLMSWAPYASDYSRYLPKDSSKVRVLVFALAGGALSSFAIEFVGAWVGHLTGSLDYFQSLNGLLGSSGWIAMITVVLGAVAANALNLYSNALTALVLDVRVKRWVAVVAGGAVGLVITAAFQAQFESFFENFLLLLAYWITPWLGIVLADFYLTRRMTTESITSAPSYNWPRIGVYLSSIGTSVPFMVPTLALPNPPFGVFAPIFGGADFSYFISFGAGLLLTILLGSKKRKQC